MSLMNVLVIGTGMYAVGRGTASFGTLLPGILEWRRTGGVGDLYVAGTSPEGVGAAREKIDALQSVTGVRVPVRYFPTGDRPDPQAYREAIRAIPRPACAVIATPDELHREMAGAAIEAGLHCLVVKPLAPTVREVRELIQLQDRHAVYAAVEFHKRYDLANLKLRDTIAAGRLGDLLSVLVQYSQRKSVPSQSFRKWAARTTVFQYLGVHYVDIVYFATGARPIRVTAVGQKNWLAARGIDTYDAVQAVLEWEAPSGRRFVQVSLTNWIDPESTTAMSEQSIKVIGTTGRFESDQKERGITIVTDEGGTEEPNPYFTQPYDSGEYVVFHGYGIDSVTTFLDDAAAVAAGTTSPADLESRRPTFRQSLVPVAVVEAANRSLQLDGEWLPIDL